MYEIYALTDVGRIREHNEDCFMVNRFVSASGEYFEVSEGNFIIAVADGMGGENAGEVASKLTLTTLNSTIIPIANEDLASKIKDIHRAILDYGINNSEAKGLGTTLTGMMCVDDRIITFNVGDSRVYRYRDGILKQLTTDHSLVHALLSAGKISREEAFDHPRKNELIQSLGGITYADRLQVDVESIRGVFEEDDILLLCSDGLNDMVRDEDMEQILASGSDIKSLAHSLVAKANDYGGHDNITVVMAIRKQEELACTDSCSLTDAS